FRRAGCIPITRGVADIAAIRQALRQLRRGAVVCLFPEGEVGEAGGRGVGRGKPGAALPAPRSTGPGYPARTRGGRSSRHWVGAWLWPSRGVRVAFGPAVDLSPYYGRRITRQLLREVTDLFMEKIEALGPRGRADAAGVAGGRINAPVKAPAAGR